MTNLNHQLGIYSTRKRNHLKQELNWLTIITALLLMGLIGRQIFLQRQNQSEIIDPNSQGNRSAIIQMAKEKSLIVKEVKEESNMIILLLESGIRAILDKKKPIDTQLDALQLITNQDKINGRKAKEIDLRFNNPIVTY